MVEFWRAATGSDFQTGGEYNNKLTHPSLRLLCKILMCVFCGHKEENKVALKDLYLLYSCVAACDIVPDWMSLFFSALRRIRKDEPRDIVGGGIISLIAE